MPTPRRAERSVGRKRIFRSPVVLAAATPNPVEAIGARASSQWCIAQRHRLAYLQHGGEPDSNKRIILLQFDFSLL
jgi:hypothetical protein